MKSFKTITDPEAFQLLADDTRRRIIHLLRAKEYTVAQIASEMGLTPQAIYHHIRKMKDFGLVEVAREERVDHFIETYYRASAEVFYCTHGSGDKSCCWDETTRDAVKGLGKIGLELNLDEKKMSELLAIRRKIGELGANEELEKNVADLEDVDFFSKQYLMEYVRVMSMEDGEFEEYLKLQNDFRNLLRSGSASVRQGKKKS